MCRPFSFLCNLEVQNGGEAMPDIKMRDVVKGTVKVIDKSVVAAERMKDAYVRTKDKAEHDILAAESSPEEYAADRTLTGTGTVVHEAAHGLDKAGRKGMNTTEENISKAKDYFRRRKADLPKKQAQDAMRRVRRSADATQKTIRVVDRSDRTIKQTAKSTGKAAVKTTQKTIKTAEQTAQTTIKTAQAAENTARKSAQMTVKTAQKAKRTAKGTARTAGHGVKAAMKATAAAVKVIISGTKALVAAIVAGGWAVVTVIILICLIALLCGSVFGIFFSGEDAGTGMRMQTAVQEINAEYDAKIEAVKSAVSYDNMEISGGRAVWKDVLAVYAVKTNTDENAPQEVATMDESKKEILSDIFWEMNSVSSRTESHSEAEVTETDDGNGNIVQTETTVTRTTLYITVSHLTVDEMADRYGFDAEQREYLAELLKDENNSIWAAVLYGIRYSDDQIVTVALSQVGNIGGQPYWSWYEFGGRVEWCACFVSWCANECGYIDSGVIPKFAGCVSGVQWFKDRGQWLDGSAEPVSGMIIFFDWDNRGSSGPQDGEADHVGIVEKCENGVVYTIEGNSGDSCRQNQYPVGHYEIFGYGVPAY